MCTFQKLTVDSDTKHAETTRMNDFTEEAANALRGQDAVQVLAQHLRNEDYYRSMFERCGVAIGPWARTADDGSVYPDGVLTIRVVEWVERTAQ